MLRTNKLHLNNCANITNPHIFGEVYFASLVFEVVMADLGLDGKKMNKSLIYHSIKGKEVEWWKSRKVSHLNIS